MFLLDKIYCSDANRFQKAAINFYLISLLAYTIGSPINLIEYFGKSLWDFVVLDLLSFIIIYTSFFFYLRRTLSFTKNCTIYVYTLLTNLIVSMWLYNYYNIEVESQILMNTFMYSINIAVAGFCINRKHAYITAFMYLILVGPLLFISQKDYLNHHAPFILFLIISFSIALTEFIKLLERFFNDELKHNEEIHNSNLALEVEQKIFLGQELEKKKKELMSKALFLFNHAEKNAEFVKTLNDFKTCLKNEEKRKLERLIHLHRYDHYKKYWYDFEKSFIEVNAEFYQKLNSSFPQLSPAESRLAGLIHLGLTSKQIACLLSHSPESVDVARSRLRSKMNLPVSTNLSLYLKNFCNHSANLD